MFNNKIENGILICSETYRIVKEGTCKELLKEFGVLALRDFRMIEKNLVKNDTPLQVDFSVTDWMGANPRVKVYLLKME